MIRLLCDVSQDENTQQICEGAAARMHSPRGNERLDELIFQMMPICKAKDSNAPMETQRRSWGGVGVNRLSVWSGHKMVGDWLLHTVAARVHNTFVFVHQQRPDPLLPARATLQYRALIFHFFHVNHLCVCFHTWISDDRTDPGTASVDKKNRVVERRAISQLVGIEKKFGFFLEKESDQGQSEKSKSSQGQFLFSFSTWVVICYAGY